MNSCPSRSFFLIRLLLTAAAAAPLVAHSAPLSPGLSNFEGSGSSGKLVPPLPSSKAPVEFFRELLALNPEQRQKLIAGRPPESQKLILAKLREYEALDPEERELRLRVTELRYYLLPLMSSQPTNRAPLLERVPAELRPLVEQRLQRWDELPPDKQKDLLDNETWVRQVAESSASNAATQTTLSNMPMGQRQALETAIARWQALGGDRRDEITYRFEQYFGLRPQERARILMDLSDKERQLMDRSLQTFNKLDAHKRARCVRALDKLAQLTPAQRDEFLRNAERWRTLTPAERKAWRDLVFNLSLPPTPRLPPPPLPNLPNSSRPATAMATNR